MQSTVNVGRKHFLGNSSKKLHNNILKRSVYNFLVFILFNIKPISPALVNVDGSGKTSC